MVDKYYFVDSNESVQNHDIINGKSGPPSGTAYDRKFFITTLTSSIGKGSFGIGEDLPPVERPQNSSGTTLWSMQVTSEAYVSSGICLIRGDIPMIVRVVFIKFSAT